MPPSTCDSADINARWWKMALIALKLVGVPIGLLVLLRSLQNSGLAITYRHSLEFLILALFVNQLALVLAAMRLLGVLRLFGIGLNGWNAVRIAFQSLFYFFFVPMSVGMEMARYWKIREILDNVSSSGLIVALITDRFLGLLAAGALIVVFLPFVPMPGLHEFEFDWYTIALLSLAAGSVIAAILWRVRLLRKLIEAWRATRESRGVLLPLLLLSIVTQFVMGLALYLSARWLGMEIGLAQTIFGQSISMLSMVIPVTILGAGPAEVTAAIAFVLLGFPPGEAALLAALTYIARLIGALQGGIWEMIEGSRLIFEAK